MEAQLVKPTRESPFFDGLAAIAAARPPVAAAKRVVIKLGTRVLTADDGHLASNRVSALVATAAAARKAGREVVLVSSGALGLGCKILGYEAPPTRPERRRACAAVGQAQLMSLYEHRFGLNGLVCAQVLVGEGDFDDRTRNLHLRETLGALLHQGVVPILNENDAVVAAQVPSHAGERRPVFGENDRMATLVAGALKADLLVLLTNVPGVYDADPTKNPGARLVTLVEDERDLAGCVAGSGSAVSRGGMRSKIEAARIAARSGCHAVIASGLEPGGLSHLLAGEEIGTWFPPQGALDGMRQWIAYSTASRGTLHLDHGAVAALTQRGASLLAKGVSAIEGQFQAGDVVELKGPDGKLVGRARIRFDHERVERWRQGEPQAEKGPLIRRSFIAFGQADGEAS